MATAAGVRAERSLYSLFGEETTTIYDPATAAENQGLYLRAFDVDAGLQFLNARYYDPRLAMFLQVQILAGGAFSGAKAGVVGVAAATEIGAGTAVASTAEKYSVYVSRTATGAVDYCGMTCNMGRRTAEQQRIAGRAIEEVAGSLSRYEARAVEQALIERYGLSNLSNKINSIAESNSIYEHAIGVGKSIAERLGL